MAHSSANSVSCLFIQLVELPGRTVFRDRSNHDDSYYGVMIHVARPIPVDQNELFIPRHFNDHLTLENGYQIGMLGEYSTHFITFNQGVFIQIQYRVRGSHIL